jgi:hypothetical protein
LQILYGTTSCDGDIFLLFRGLLYKLPVWASRKDKQALFHATSAVPGIGMSMERILESQAMFLPVKVKQVIYGNGFESLLSKCEEQLCAEPRDKVYAILRLPHDVKEGDIPIDYNASIPQLYERALAWSLRREGVHSAVDRFSGVIQRALLGPLSLDDSPVEMFKASSPQHANLCFTEPEMDYEINSVLVQQIWIIPLSTPWNEVTLEDIRNPEQLLGDTPEYLKNMDQTQLSFSLERLWELDSESILSFEGKQSSNRAKLFAFTCRSGTRIGLGPDCLQDADILCRLHGMHTLWLYAVARITTIAL